MGNTCVVRPPPSMPSSQLYIWQSTSATTVEGVKNPANFHASAKQSSTSSPFQFNADEYGIVCLSFPEAGDSESLFGLNAKIVTLQNSLLNTQNELSTLQALSSADAPGFMDRIDDQAAVWSLFLGALVVVLCLKGIYRLFNGGPHAD